MLHHDPTRLVPAVTAWHGHVSLSCASKPPASINVFSPSHEFELFVFEDWLKLISQNDCSAFTPLVTFSTRAERTSGPTRRLDATSRSTILDAHEFPLSSAMTKQIERAPNG